MSPNIAYVWVTPAFRGRIPGADHTWVTSYDLQTSKYKNIEEVKNAGHQYWYCRGDFYTEGYSKRYLSAPVLKCDVNINVSGCLVKPNNKKGRGTISYYGINGVCHQVTNQILSLSSKKFLGPLRSKIRGYQLSCNIYGLYGTRRSEWYEKREACTPVQLSNMPKHSHFMRCLFRRPTLRPFILQLESKRKKLLRDIRNIGLAKRDANETNQQRANKLNERINQFLAESYSVIEKIDISPPNAVFHKIYGVKPDERINLIDPKIFKIPDDNDPILEKF